MTTAFKRIALIGRHRTEGAVETLDALIKHLIKRGDVDLLLEAGTAESLKGYPDIPRFEREEIGAYCDLVIVVGGDGSLLNAAHAVVAHDVPIVGINRGRLGFLTDINPKEVESRIDEILAGNYYEEIRFLLHADIVREGRVEARNGALNEIVLYAGDVARMIEFEVYIDKQFVYSQRSDGLIIATPTGSTAYSLSGGGPIMHPKLDAIVLVPMFPHTLTSRPIVVSSDSEIELVIAPNMNMYPGISCDGQAPILLTPGDVARIVKKEEKLRLIHPMDHDYYQVLRTKLQWGTKWETQL